MPEGHPQTMKIPPRPPLAKGGCLPARSRFGEGRGGFGVYFLPYLTKPSDVTLLSISESYSKPLLRIS